MPFYTSTSKYSHSLLGINGTPPIFSSFCFRVNLTANQRGDYERMRCRYNMIIEVSAAVSKIVAVTVSSKGRFAARFTENFAHVLSILDCSCVCVPPRFHERSFWKLGIEVNVKWLISLAWLSWPKQNIIPGFALLTKFHEPMRLDTKAQTKLGRTIPFTYQINSFLCQASMKRYREGF